MPKSGAPYQISAFVCPQATTINSSFQINHSLQMSSAFVFSLLKGKQTLTLSYRYLASNVFNICRLPAFTDCRELSVYLKCQMPLAFIYTQATTISSSSQINHSLQMSSAFAYSPPKGKQPLTVLYWYLAPNVFDICLLPAFTDCCELICYPKCPRHLYYHNRSAYAEV